MSEIYTLKTTANREEQVLDFVVNNIKKKGLNVYSVFHPHGMRGYIFVEAETKDDAQKSYQGVPYAKGLLRAPVNYQEVEHMLEQAKAQVNIQNRDIVEIISGPFKGEKARVTRIEEQKEEIILELLESAVPIPITVKLDSVKVIRRDKEDE
ncbi:transcription elongation factor Spt5 [Candidatus Woesearchaeota archaeon]|nr:transcription elongation factor Spt5 [Candidatus Woesearchaeota archaeon]